MRARRFIAIVVAAVAMCFPAVALACPYCAGRNDGGIAQAIALGSFVFFPFAVAATVIRIIRRGETASNDATSGDSLASRPTT